MLIKAFPQTACWSIRDFRECTPVGNSTFQPEFKGQQNQFLNLENLWDIDAHPKDATCICVCGLRGGTTGLPIHSDAEYLSTYTELGKHFYPEAL